MAMWKVVTMQNRSKEEFQYEFDYILDLGEFISELDTDTYELISVERGN